MQFAPTGLASSVRIVANSETSPKPKNLELEIASIGKFIGGIFVGQASGVCGRPPHPWSSGPAVAGGRSGGELEQGRPGGDHGGVVSGEGWGGEGNAEVAVGGFGGEAGAGCPCGVGWSFR